MGGCWGRAYTLHALDICIICPPFFNTEDMAAFGAFMDLVLALYPALVFQSMGFSPKKTFALSVMLSVHLSPTHQGALSSPGRDSWKP